MSEAVKYCYNSPGCEDDHCRCDDEDRPMTEGEAELAKGLDEFFEEEGL